MLFSKVLERTGVGNHIHQLSDELFRQGHRVIVVSGTNKQGIGGENVDFEGMQTTSRNIFVVLKNIRKLHNIIVRNNIDVVHCHHRVAALYIKLHNIIYTKIPVVYTLHLAPVPSDFLHRAFTFPGDCAIGVASETSDFLIQGLKVPKEKVVTVLNGVDKKQLRELSLQEKAAVFRKCIVKKLLCCVAAKK